MRQGNDPHEMGVSLESAKTIHTSAGHSISGVIGVTGTTECCRTGGGAVGIAGAVIRSSSGPSAVVDECTGLPVPAVPHVTAAIE